MLLTTEIKQKIIAAIASNRPNFLESDAKYAVSLGINKAVYARLKKGETNKVLADAKWLSIARRLNVMLGNEPAFRTAPTAIYSYLNAQFSMCQSEATTGIFCDLADIGKTHAAKDYVRNNAGAVYVDCSQVKSKQKLVRFIAKELGVDHNGTYADVYADLVYYLSTSNSATLIILDEVGDLDYTAFLEIKALWNATENHCGWFMLGADGLKKKIDNGIARKKVGFTEIFSRFGAKYSQIVPTGSEARDEFLSDQIAAVISVNLPGCTAINELVKKSTGSLRRVRKEISKFKRSAA